MTSGPFDLSGKTALVTGGARGLGLACATALRSLGARVLITCRRPDDGAAALQQLRATAGADGRADMVVGDLGSADGIEELAHSVTAREEAIHVLVNNAGVAWAAPLADYPDRAWSKLAQLNLAAPFQLVQHLLPALEAAGRPDDPSRVVNIGSVDGLSVGPFENFAYGASKAGLHHLTRVLAHHLAGRRIAVNCVVPGPIRTTMTDDLLGPVADDLVAANPLRRLGQPEDVAGVVAFLASPAAAYVNGAVIPVDGGYSSRPWALD